MRLVSASPRPMEPASDAPGEGVSSSGAAGAEARAIETALALRAQEGDVEAFAVLVERRTPGLVAFLRRMLGDAEDARDVAQLTFLRVWENMGRYDPAWAFSTWLFRIAGNLAIDALRARRTRQRTETESFRLVKGARTSESDAPAALHRDDVRRVFEACAGVLSGTQRLVFVLREFEERDGKDIAAILECRESTVRNHLFQARRLLRDEIRKRYPEYTSGF
ncbi:MAG TPA: sigma-70 family RNA polymerase sigma factor [Thermoanaerobaculia bacterium]|nr:sigma-70 family RNA polymerase sigma factor [Thermoanaerobaculia bacterium]